MFYVIFYYVWKFFASIYFGDEFVKTKHVPPQNFVGRYYQLMQTPNPFQKTGLASATYYFDNYFDVENNDNDSSNFDKNKKKIGNIKIINREYKIINGKAVIDSFIKGYIEETKVDPGTFFVFFDNSFRFGLYRILQYEFHPRLGTYMFISSLTPKYSWLLWKPPLDKSNLINSYEYGLSKINWFENLDDVIIVQPNHLYEMIELDTNF